MFKLVSLQLNCNGNKKRIIEFKNNTSYIFAPNSKGKTLLCECVDYALGGGENVLSKPAMKGVHSIETIIQVNSQENLYFLRDNEGLFYYKIGNDSVYRQFNQELYNERITALLLGGDDTEVVGFSEVFDWQISHRSMSFLNFLDQNGMGDLKYIFSKASSEKYRWYYKDILNYIFNYEKIREIVILTKNLKKKVKIYNNLKQTIDKYLVKRDLLFSELRKLGIQVDSITDARDALLKFEKNYTRPDTTVKEKDLNFLLVASQSLAEEIKVQQCFNEQGKLIISRQKNIQKLLNFFMGIVKENDSLNEYILPIMELILEAKTKADTFSSLDVSETIKKLQVEKEELDNQLYMLQEQLVKLDYKDTEKSIGIAKQMLSDIDSYGNIEDIKQLETEISDLKKKIDLLKKSFDTSKQDIINSAINASYKCLEDKCAFISEDLEKGGEIIFDAKLAQLYGYMDEEIELANGVKEKHKIQYIPGSMARQTTWQILCYLYVMDYTLKIHRGLPLMPLLVLDNISMPFDVNTGKNNYAGIYSFIKQFAEENGIQIILTSNIPASEVGEQNQIDLSDGLNPIYAE